jgi:hypothetical protein
MVLMSTPTLADIWQLQQRIPGGIAETDLARALAALEDASAWIRAEAFSMTGEDWLDDAGALETVPGAVVSVCCSVARRILDNPDGLLQESIAGYSYSRTNATTDIYLTKGELKMLRRALGIGSFSVATLEGAYTPPWSPYEDRVVGGGGYDGYDDWYTPQ